MKLWLVKFYIKIFPTLEKYNQRVEEKEIHSYFVDSEEKADFLVEAFTSTGTSAKKIELEG